ncbi:hypothetical protein LTR91_002949 [Friedmanniomyces endolithicus]|uniref:Uncharacterized protein n=1 Tax=Friedmanniomyces endolithicus TaxID=329885 RepID=A0AAN6QZ99_9PEZI|nr:hypothetical protein LTR94_006421 [Friedmanniomyces endolithicus]KAK0778579.1 hypothetical protein LTR59_013442 [Friedmanniomyces endolithicus]KAK0785982.1 hypothetical protein LTR38_012152 [Friedmanniomyces endolithicus]KAK0814512.1 hypothetical protein LTR75_004220 [Friedmanniomyces endolithicus]KAK0850548.1 hypothetical protein LTR03_004520 [Friedmanniomyces endolithicus]
MSDFTNYVDPLDNWDIINDADWLEAAIALDPDDPGDQLGFVVGDIASAPNWTALANNSTAPWLGQHYDEANSADPLQRHGPPSLINANAITTAIANAAAIIVCPSIDGIPRGRQQAKILKCGFPGCISNARFDRPHELERHMALHFPGNYPGVQPGCIFTGMTAFKRADKLRKHEREAHGL